ncbi:hypothetical protein F8B43_1864 [Methylorubrum populi]|uniref:Uncharacterized protein n=1 Tax=Methylorubrum populi TaxID=223967 RepID=A0A833J664_9HYPH|nr:hypothetical protein F8B43_1864 [Methylorubrum populi]
MSSWAWDPSMARLSWHEALLDEDEDRAQVRAARIRRLAAGDAAPNAVEAAGVQRLDVLDDRAAKADNVVLPDSTVPTHVARVASSPWRMRPR